MAIFKRTPEQLKQLREQTFDVLIVGGGISGAWLALHCAQSGIKTALIEQGDFASQTSSSSSKLLHGGIRYLQQMQFDKVRESAIERAHYVYAAPHLSTAVPFAVPTFRDFQRSKFFLNCGMLAYRILCLGENRIIGAKDQHLPPIRSISSPQLNAICDLGDQPHTGAVVFYERHMINSERMVLSILKSAATQSALVFNNIKCQSFISEHNSVVGVKAKDMLSEEEFPISAKLVINAAGPWIDNLNGTLTNADTAPSINGFAIGSHIITRQLADHAIALTTKHQSDAKIDRGGRHVFIIPWRGCSLIGTSYDEIRDPNGDLSLTSEHVEQLLEVINESLPNANLSKDDLISGYSGLYPLKTDNIKSTVYQGTGEYQIIDHANANGVEGLLTALGAKFTTGRKLSALAMRVVAKKLDRAVDLSKIRLFDSEFENVVDYRATKVTQYQDLLCADTVEHLFSHYGSEIDKLIERIKDQPALLDKISPTQNDIFGQIVWAIEEEQAQSLSDIIFRRTSLGYLGLQKSELESVAKLMAQQLAWSPEKQNQEVQDTLKTLLQTKSALDSGFEA